MSVAEETRLDTSDVDGMHRQGASYHGFNVLSLSSQVSNVLMTTFSDCMARVLSASIWCAVPVHQCKNDHPEDGHMLWMVLMTAHTEWINCDISLKSQVKVAAGVEEEKPF